MSTAALVEQLREALAHPNAQAFLRVIREGETTQTPDAYRMLFGGDLIDSLADHPRRAITKPLGGKPITSTAAGAYQFLSRTWDECARALGLKNFGQDAQDLAAMFLIRRRGALADVLAGRLEAAIRKCAREWASLPGSPYGQPTKTMPVARRVFAQWGGIEEGVATPAAPVATKPKEADVPLPAFIAAALPAVIQAAPALARMFSSGSEVAERNIKAAEMVVAIAKEATGSVNEQELVETLKTDPAAPAIVRQAIQEKWFELTEAGGGGIEGARRADERFTAPDGPRFWYSPAFWISTVLLAMPFALVIDVLFVHPENYTGELRTQIVTAILAVIAMVGGYWIGTSFSSSKKDDARAAEAAAALRR